LGAWRTASDWFPLGVGDSSLQRITLDFGLRGANQHFLELVVPEIGVRYVRQLSWAAAGLAMRDDLAAEGSKYRATQLANAIEALGCKAEWMSGSSASTRVIGRRAFDRDGKSVGSFRELWPALRDVLSP